MKNSEKVIKSGKKWEQLGTIEAPAQHGVRSPKLADSALTPN